MSNMWRTGKYRIEFRSGKISYLQLSKANVKFLECHSNVFDICGITYISNEEAFQNFVKRSESIYTQKDK